MKRPTFVNTRLHEDAADAYSTTGPNSGNIHLDGGVSPYVASNDANLSDCDSYSDSSRRMRKKRNTYQKIPDDIRMQLLEAVQNGETLKAAAKRHKINYSSAKSILHTYRKEGRILKKSAQERTTKKRALPMSDFENSSKTTKQAKKENVHTGENDYPYAHSFASPSRKVKRESSNNNSEEASFRNPKKVLVENSSNSKYSGHQYESHSDNQPLTLPDSVHKEDESTMRMMTITENEHPSEANPTSEPAYKDENSVHKFKLFDNFYFNHHYETPTEYIFGDSNDYMAHMTYPKEFEAFQETSNAIRKASTHENDHTGFDDKTAFISNAFDFDMAATDPNCPFKSFMDTQRLLREALRKASFTSFNGKYGGYRKGSVDFL